MIFSFCTFRLLEMGCFGVGVSRLLAAALEYGLSGESERLSWPTAIAPYHICVACLAHVREYQECIRESTQLHTVVWHIRFD